MPVLVVECAFLSSASSTLKRFVIDLIRIASPRDAKDRIKILVQASIAVYFLSTRARLRYTKCAKRSSLSSPFFSFASAKVSPELNRTTKKGSHACFVQGAPLPKPHLLEAKLGTFIGNQVNLGWIASEEEIALVKEYRLRYYPADSLDSEKTTTVNGNETVYQVEGLSKSTTRS